jgi:hypothetical protein
MDGWRTDEKGDIIACPLVKWTVNAAFDASVLIQLQYRERLEDRGKPAKWLQLSMSPSAAMQVSRNLLEMAESILRSSKGDAPEKPS